MTRNARTRTLAVTIVLALLAFAGTTRAHEITRRTFTFSVNASPSRSRSTRLGRCA